MRSGPAACPVRGGARHRGGPPPARAGACCFSSSAMPARLAAISEVVSNVLFGTFNLLLRSRRRDGGLVRPGEPQARTSRG